MGKIYPEIPRFFKNIQVFRKYPGIQEIPRYLGNTQVFRKCPSI